MLSLTIVYRMVRQPGLKGTKNGPESTVKSQAKQTFWIVSKRGWASGLSALYSAGTYSNCCTTFTS